LSINNPGSGGQDGDIYGYILDAKFKYKKMDKDRKLAIFVAI
jgi:hypothetical protein